VKVDLRRYFETCSVW